MKNFLTEYYKFFERYKDPYTENGAVSQLPIQDQVRAKGSSHRSNWDEKIAEKLQSFLDHNVDMLFDDVRTTVGNFIKSPSKAFTDKNNGIC